MVNNVPVKEMGTQVDPKKDEVRIKGGPVIVLAKEQIVLMMNKPKGYVCTRSDEHAKRTVFDLLPDQYQGLFTIGRLDKDSEGLLLFTNDGELSQQLGHPRHGKKKVYQVTVRGQITEKELESIRKGMRLLEYKTAPAEAKLLYYDAKEGKSTVEIILKEGKKRQIRNMFLSLKKPVKKLVRVAFGNYRLEKLKPGEWMRVRTS